MRGCLGGCLGRAFGLLLLAGLGAAAWTWGPGLLEEARQERGFLSSVLPEPVAAWVGGSSGPRGSLAGGREVGGGAVLPTPELAEQAESGIVALVAGEVEEIELSAAELESLLHYRFPLVWPEGVSAPSVSLREGELHLGLRVAQDRIPRLPELDPLLGFLPDTVPVSLQGRVLALGSGEAALFVSRIEASAIPIPRRFFPRILEGVRGPGDDELPPEAVRLPLPPGIRSAVVLDDRLLLRRAP